MDKSINFTTSKVEACCYKLRCMMSHSRDIKLGKALPTRFAQFQGMLDCIRTDDPSSNAAKATKKFHYILILIGL